MAAAVVGGGLGDTESHAQPPDIGPVTEPGQHEHRLLPAGQGARARPGADLMAATGQQPGHEQHRLDRDIEHDTIRQHVEPSGQMTGLWRDLFYRGLRAARGSPVMSTSLPIWASRPRMTSSLY